MNFSHHNLFPVCLSFLCARSFPAVRGGDVRTVGAGVGCSGCLHSPALNSVWKLQAVSQLWAVLHVCPCWHFLLLSGWPSFCPHWLSHPDSLPVTLTNSFEVKRELEMFHITSVFLLLLFYQQILHIIPFCLPYKTRTLSWHICGVNDLIDLGHFVPK